MADDILPSGGAAPSISAGSDRHSRPLSTSPRELAPTPRRNARLRPTRRRHNSLRRRISSCRQTCSHNYPTCCTTDSARIPPYPRPHDAPSWRRSSSTIWTGCRASTAAWPSLRILKGFMSTATAGPKNHGVRYTARSCRPAAIIGSGISRCPARFRRILGSE